MRKKVNSNPELLGGLKATSVAAFQKKSIEVFQRANSSSRKLADENRSGFVNGVPMQWMLDWPLPFPLFVRSAKGATLTDVDDNVYSDFCLGDTGAMFGHSPPAVAEAVARQATRGFTHMLQTEDAAAVQELLVEKFGLPVWQLALSATDANRFALRLARAITGRKKLLVFHGCYHGTVDETFVRLRNGIPIERPGLIGQSIDLTDQTVVVEFNDLQALEAALSTSEIACVLTEPVLTNSSMVLPAHGFHEGLRALTAKYQTLLILDETHTISSGYGGYMGRHGLSPDIWVCGKAIAGGVPTAVWGMSTDVAKAYEKCLAEKVRGHSGIGTTLSANALSMTALRANLESMIRPEVFGRMEATAEAMTQGLTDVIRRQSLPWHISRVGARVEFIFSPTPLKNGTEAEATHLTELEQALHIGLLNRGVLIAPFHNMMLASPETSKLDVRRLLTGFSAVVEAIKSCN